MSKWSPDQIMSGAGSSPINFGAIAGHNPNFGGAPAAPASGGSKASTPASASPGNISVSPGFGSMPSGGGYSGPSGPSGPSYSPDQVMAQQAAVAPAPPAPTLMTAEQRKAFSEAASVRQAELSTILPVEKGAPPSNWVDSLSNTTTAPNVKMSAAAQATPPALDSLARNPEKAAMYHERTGYGVALPQSMAGGALGDKDIRSTAKQWYGASPSARNEAKLADKANMQLFGADKGTKPTTPTVPTTPVTPTTPTMYPKVDVEWVTGGRGPTKLKENIHATDNFSVSQHGGSMQKNTEYLIGEGSVMDNYQKAGVTIDTNPKSLENFSVQKNTEVYTGGNIDELLDKNR